MLKSLSRSIKSNWKRTLSGLLAVITILGMLPATALAAEGTPAKAASSVAVYAPTGDFEVNIAGATGWNGTCRSLPVYSAESGGSQIAAVPPPGRALRAPPLGVPPGGAHRRTQGGAHRRAYGGAHQDPGGYAYPRPHAEAHPQAYPEAHSRSHPQAHSGPHTHARSHAGAYPGAPGGRGPVGVLRERHQYA